MLNLTHIVTTCNYYLDRTCYVLFVFWYFILCIIASLLIIAIIAAMYEDVP